MAKVFDTEARDRSSLAPPTGKCHVCVESKSLVAPDKATGHSYELIGLFMDEQSATRHASEAQAAFADKVIVAFDLGGKEIYRGAVKAKAVGKAA
jgi:hypothetical protein